MVDLPSIAERVPQVQAPQSRASAGQIASPYLELAASLDSAAKETGDVAKLLAHNEGLKAVTRDADGNVQVQRPPIVGDAAIAYQHAVTVAAAADGEAVAKADLVEMRHKFPDDPEGFRKAAASYRSEKVGQYQKAAGPDVGVALGRTIDSLSTEHYNGLLNQKERLDLHRSAASINAQIDTAKNELIALKNGGAPDDSPDVQQRLQKIGALYGQLVNNPRMGLPQERVDYDIGQLKAELHVAGLDYRIGRLQAEQGPAAALAEAEKVRTDPSLNLTPGQRQNYYSRLIGGIQQRINAQNSIDTATDAEIKEIGGMAARGFTVPPAQMAAIRQRTIASGNPALNHHLQVVEQTAPIIADWRRGSPAQIERNLSGLDQVMRDGEATPENLAIYDTGVKLLTSMRAGLKTDPLGWADRTGAFKVPTLDFSKPDIGVQMRGRAAVAEAAAAHYGIDPSYLKPDERAAIGAATAQGGTAMTEAAGLLVSGFGDRAPRVLAEISKESPVLAHIGGLMTSGGSTAVMRDAAEAVRLRQDKEFKLPHWLDKPSDKILAAQHARTIDQYGAAFTLAPDTGRAAEMTAAAAFFTRSARHGYDPLFVTGDDTAGKAAYDRALQEAAGATFDPKGVRFGGIGEYGTRAGAWFEKNKVLIPGNVRADRFGDVLGAVKDEDVGGKWQSRGRFYGVSDLQRAVPVAAQGGYRFALGDPNSDDPKWVPAADGRPFTLDIEKLDPVLRRRVPGAYADGR